MAHFCPPHIAPCTCCGLCSPVLRLEQRNAHEVDEWMRCNRNPQIPPEVGGIVWMHGNAPSAFLAVGSSKVISKYRWLLPTYAPGVWGMSEEGGPCSAGAINSHCSQRAICLTYDFRWKEDYSEAQIIPWACYCCAIPPCLMRFKLVREDGERWDRWSSCCCDAWGGSSYKAKWVVVPDGEPGKGGVRRTAFYEEMCATIPKDCRIVAGGGSAAAVVPCEQMERGEPGA